MKVKIFVFLFTILYLINSYGDSKKIIFSDKAIFKIDNIVLFKSDLRKFVKAVYLLDCLYPDSWILKGINLDTSEIKIFLKIKKNTKKDIKFQNNFYNKILKFFILKQYIYDNKLIFKIKKNDLKQIKKCEGYNKLRLKNATYYDQVFSVEYFLRKRYSKSDVEDVVKELIDTLYRSTKHDKYF